MQKKLATQTNLILTKILILKAVYSKIAYSGSLMKYCRLKNVHNIHLLVLD